MEKIQKTIKVTVDKSHLLTLGERMYGESIELIRELVNNAYDADATEVYISLNPDTIAVEDNGTGMNEKNLTQFFAVGSPEKKTHSLSSKFGRKRIGQFGIGKFAALSAADQFIVESKKNNWVYQVIFDRKNWEDSETWELPITKESATPFSQEGTKVILTKLKKQFLANEIEKHLRQSVPLRAKKFAVYLNKKRITKKEIIGRRVPINFKTIYGTIEGEVIIAINPKEIEEPGIECKVKQVLIKRELFGLEKSHNLGISRITGEVNADFLPILASRDNFIRDSLEYQLFKQLITSVLTKILDDFKKESERKNLKKISKELKEVLDRVRKALELNPDFVPSGKMIALLKKKKENFLAVKREKIKKEKIDSKEEIEKERILAQIAKPLIQKRIQLKKLGVSVGIVSLGKEGLESLAEGNLIYINQDHPLYQRFYQNHDSFLQHLARLITKEIILMKKLRISTSQAYEFQSKLLTDIFVNPCHS